MQGMFLKRFMLATAAVVLGPGFSAIAQYQELRIGEKLQSPSAVRQYKSVKSSVLKGSEPYAQRRDDMLDYYKKYLLPAFTRQDQRSKWSDLRKEVLLDLKEAKVAQARADVLKLVGSFCANVAGNDQYDPETRYQALLLLGDLNQREAVDTKPPLPFPAVLPRLMSILEAADAPVMLKYAAIQGILRHAELCGHPKSEKRIDDKQRLELVQLMVKVARDANVPEDVDAPAHDWLRARSVEVLGNLYETPAPVVELLAELIADQSADLNVRAAAAMTLGKLAKSVDPSLTEDFSGRLAKLALDAANAELAYLQQMQGPGARDAAGSIPNRDRGPRRDIDSPDTEARPRAADLEIADIRTAPSRRRLLFRLLAVRQALVGDSRQGIDGLAVSGNAGPFVEPVKRAVDALITAINDVESDYQTFGAKIAKAVTNDLPPLVPATLGNAKRDVALAPVSESVERVGGNAG